MKRICDLKTLRSAICDLEHSGLDFIHSIHTAARPKSGSRLRVGCMLKGSYDKTHTQKTLRKGLSQQFPRVTSTGSLLGKPSENPVDPRRIF